MTLVRGQQWTDYECVHSQNEGLPLPVRHTAAVRCRHYVHKRTTPSPHTVHMHKHQVCTDTCASRLCNCANVSDPSRANQNVRILLAFLFYVLCTRILKMCSSVGVCILHMSAFDVLCTLLFWIRLISAGFLLLYMWGGRGGGGGGNYCLLQWLFKAVYQISSSIMQMYG